MAVLNDIQRELAEIRRLVKEKPVPVDNVSIAFTPS